MTWVKICGMTNLEDALTAVDAGADAVGFVFYEKSPRNISVEAAREIVEKLPESVEKIGVFVRSDDVDPVRCDVQGRINRNSIVHFARGRPIRQRSQGGARFVSSTQARFLTALPMNLVGADPEQLQHLTTVFRSGERNSTKRLQRRAKG